VIPQKSSETIPEISRPLERKYELYATSATRHVSIWGYRDKEVCLRERDMKRPNATPRAMDAAKVHRKIPIPWKKEDI
jgi:hypothetical protein